MAATRRIADVCASIVPRLVSHKDVRDASFINLPMLYPSGSFVTVRVTLSPSGIRVSDAGFAYREAEGIGAGRSFSGTARSLAEKTELSVGKRAIFLDVSEEEVERAIYDVSAASRTVAENIVSRISAEEEENIADVLQQKLDHIFPQAVEYESGIKGASATEWKMSAVANVEGRRAVFDTVLNFANAVYKTSTAFHDLAALESPPSLVAVIANRKEMGNRYSILAQAGRVIEISQSNDTFRRAVAA